MERFNSEAIPRHKLIEALKDAFAVRIARRIDRCLLCKRPGVNEAALCDVCWTLITEDELALAQRWLNGVAP